VLLSVIFTSIILSRSTDSRSIVIYQDMFMGGFF
jgi:hypothetical protein